jgi:DNA-binding GntR family transcriptional regulator
VQDLEEHYEIRTALECLAAEHAAIRFRPSDSPPLRAMLAQMQECRDPDEYVALNHAFHMAVYALSGRRRLVEMIEQLRTASQAYLQINSEQLVPTGDAQHEHDDILAACEANDPVRAAEATREHLQARRSAHCRPRTHLAGSADLVERLQRHRHQWVSGRPAAYAGEDVA